MTPPDLDRAKVTGVLDEVFAERVRQHDRWGQQDLPDGEGSPQVDQHTLLLIRAANASAVADGTLTWDLVLLEEVAEALVETDPVKRRAELIQVAAVAASWVEALDRRGSKP